MADEVFLVDVDLHRLGNSTSPRLDHVRLGGPKPDITTFDDKGVTMVVADGHGVSTFTWEELQKRNVSGWVWKIPTNTPLPLGLTLLNDHGGHYMIAPLRPMPLSEYEGLLRKLAERCHRLLKLEGRK